MGNRMICHRLGLAVVMAASNLVLIGNLSAAPTSHP